MAEHCCYCWSPGHHCARVALCENHARGEALKVSIEAAARLTNDAREDEAEAEARAERAEAEVKALRAEVERLRAEVANEQIDTYRMREEIDYLRADRDRAATEALEHAAEVEALRAQVADMDRHISDLDGENRELYEYTAPKLALAEAEVERLHKLRDQSVYADGEHMADLAVTIKIQAGQIATLSNQLDYANEGKSALEAELVRLRADRDAYRARIDAVRALCDASQVVSDAAGIPNVVKVSRLRAALDGNE